MILQVQTFILHTDRDDTFENEFFLNIDKPDAPARLLRLIAWAARNGRSVTTFAKGA